MVIGCLFLLLVCVVCTYCLPLYRFVRNVEDERVCEMCGRCNECFARKRILYNSNILSEFMLISYYRVKSYCDNAERISGISQIIYFLFSAMLAGLLYWSRGGGVSGVAFGVSAIMLLALSVVDWNTQYIPVEYTGVIFICGLIRLFADVSNWWEYVIGLIAVSGFLYIVDIIATPILRKRYGNDEISHVMGDGDIKLMAATGLLLGWKLNILALGMGCVIGSIIHIILMQIKKGERQFAFGPYLSLGVYITMICGEQLVSWYLNMMRV